MNRIRVSIKNRPYDILIGSNMIDRSGAILKKLDLGGNALIITNKALAGMYGKRIKASLKRAGIDCALLTVPDSEKAKSDKVLIGVLNSICSYDKNKTPFLIALGGGVVGDLTGFAASVYKRGIPYIQVPTTLLAQVDSAIGGKTAIDLPIAKNLVGSFYQPKAVISDISSLKSLSARQIRSGLAECIKYGVIKDRKLFSYLEKNYKRALSLDENVLKHIISACSRIKARVVKEDELDKKGKRIILNFGHTVGHAIESACGYSGKYNHGEAVAIGMICASRISSKLGLIRRRDRSRIEDLIKKCALPATMSGLDIKRIQSAMLRDKKFIHGKNRFVLPVSIGKVKIVEGIKRSIIMDSIKECAR